MSAASRLSRAVTGAALSTLVALASHVLAGGAMPSAPGIAVPLLLSTAVCFQLAGKELSLWRLSVAVVASQWIFHQLFVLGAGGAQVTSSGGIHAGHEWGSISVHGAAHSHSDGPMTLAHLIGAAVTITAIFKAEQLLAILGRCRQWLQSSVLWQLPLAATPARRVTVAPASLIDGWRLCPPVVDVASSPVSRRGPPVLHR